MAKKVVVIGGGAAGLISAYYTAKAGNETTIIERNEKLGKKIYITGKGRCNVTNDSDCEEFLSNVVSNPKFLMSAIYSFPPSSLMSLLENEGGLQLKTERGNRVFPLSDKSSDVIKTLSMLCFSSGVKALYDHRVLKIIKNENNQFVLETELYNGKTEKIFADKVIIATGGTSYTSTGSDGDGYRFAKSFGHTIVEPIASLSALKCEGNYFESVMGLALKNVRLDAECNGKKVASEFGEMLFTHFGVSGPIVLTISAKINRLIGKNVSLYLDLKPALDDKQLDNRILRDFAEQKGKMLKNSLNMLLPRNLIEIIIDRAQIDENKKIDEISKEERLRLVDSIKRFEIKVTALAPLDQAIVTSGGVSTREINPKTMESKLVEGLYFAGEVIDVDALTGGFNLQIAFSTGYLAGNNV